MTDGGRQTKVEFGAAGIYPQGFLCCLDLRNRRRELPQNAFVSFFDLPDLRGQRNRQGSMRSIEALIVLLYKLGRGLECALRSQTFKLTDPHVPRRCRFGVYTVANVTLQVRFCPVLAEMR
jgi:hypothetical protein